MPDSKISHIKWDNQERKRALERLERCLSSRPTFTLHAHTSSTRSKLTSRGSGYATKIITKGCFSTTLEHLDSRRHFTRTDTLDISVVSKSKQHPYSSEITPSHCELYFELDTLGSNLELATQRFQDSNGELHPLLDEHISFGPPFYVTSKSKTGFKRSIGRHSRFRRKFAKLEVPAYMVEYYKGKGSDITAFAVTGSPVPVTVSLIPTVHLIEKTRDIM